MKLFATIVLMVLILFPAGSALAQTAALSLSIPPTARANAMGQAYVAVADDATASWWNPAGLGFQKTKKDASVTHAQLVPDLADDVFHEYLAFGFPIKKWGTFALSLVYLTYGESQARGPSGEDLGTFNSYEVAPQLSYGTSVLGDQLGIGVTFKYIRVELAPDLPNIPGSGQGSTVALDFGGLWRVPGDRLNLGLALQNLGPEISFIAEDRSDPIYRNLKAGFGLDVYSNESVSFLLVGDYNQLLVRGEQDSDGDGNFESGPLPAPIWNGGGEFEYRTSDIALALRGGYVYDKDGSINDPTYGLGIQYKILRLDLASIPQAEDPNTGDKLDRVTKFSLGARF